MHILSSESVALVIEGTQEPKARMSVPLCLLDDYEADHSGLRLYEDGVVWEDEPYSLFLRLRTSSAIAHASLSVNDHEPLTLWHNFPQPAWIGSEFSYDYQFELAHDGPFALTCGFARAEIHLEFVDGTAEELVSLDIVSLDEPGEDDLAEEGNVRRMLEQLSQTQDNQAAEWMFSQVKKAPLGGPLSSDKMTDWAFGSIAARLETASKTLDLVYDGLENRSDAFPNVTCYAAEKRSSHDTHENRCVRAMLASMRQQGLEVRTALERMVRELQDLLLRVDQLVERGARQAGKAVPSVPARTVLVMQEHRARQLLCAACDVGERIEDALRTLDDPVEGIGQVAAVPFAVPQARGLFCSDSAYRKLHAAMRMWAACAEVPLERVDLSLHVVKPDRLYEYFALHQMLAWLRGHGFHENRSNGEALVQYDYELERTYFKYENEHRCANTYHLTRRSYGKDVNIDVYYQPVIYRDAREENGITLHRVDPLEPSEGEGREDDFWTPDYLLVVTQGNGRCCHYLVDAKYQRRASIRNQLRECVRKYRSQTSTSVAGTPGCGIGGVVILTGRLDAACYMRGHGTDATGSYLQMIVPCNSASGTQGLDTLFEAMGVR